jgi:hypothetical protein
LRREAFNFLNRANLGIPRAYVDSPDVGTISSAAAARTVQVGLRLDF